MMFDITVTDLAQQIPEFHEYLEILEIGTFSCNLPIGPTDVLRNCMKKTPFRNHTHSTTVHTMEYLLSTKHSYLLYPTYRTEVIELLRHIFLFFFRT